MKTKQALAYILTGAVICGAVAAAVFAPEQISRSFDKGVIDAIVLEEKDSIEGYQYALSPDERLYVLSNALKNRILPQSEYFAAARDIGLSDLRIQSYAFQTVYKESEYNERTRADAINAMEKEYAAYVGLGLFPALEFDLSAGSFDAALYMAIDVLEPKKNVSVWQIKDNRVLIREGLVECVMDAQTKKFYTLSLRSSLLWDEYAPDEAILAWAERLGLSSPTPYEESSALLEDAAYYNKYTVSGMDGEGTIVTLGFYTGINEFFIRIN